MIVTERRKKCLEEFSKTGLDGVLFAAGANFQYLYQQFPRKIGQPVKTVFHIRSFGEHMSVFAIGSEIYYWHIA